VTARSIQHVPLSRGLPSGQVLPSGQSVATLGNTCCPLCCACHAIAQSKCIGPSRQTSGSGSIFSSGVEMWWRGGGGACGLGIRRLWSAGGLQLCTLHIDAPRLLYFWSCRPAPHAAPLLLRSAALPCPGRRSRTPICTACVLKSISPASGARQLWHGIGTVNVGWRAGREVDGRVSFATPLSLVGGFRSVRELMCGRVWRALAACTHGRSLR